MLIFLFCTRGILLIAHITCEFAEYSDALRQASLQWCSNCQHTYGLVKLMLHVSLLAGMHTIPADHIGPSICPAHEPQK